jgi:hypothetical protein
VACASETSIAAVVCGDDEYLAACQWAPGHASTATDVVQMGPIDLGAVHINHASYGVPGGRRRDGASTAGMRIAAYSQ